MAEPPADAVAYGRFVFSLDESPSWCKSKKPAPGESLLGADQAEELVLQHVFEGASVVRELRAPYSFAEHRSAANALVDLARGKDCQLLWSGDFPPSFDRS